MASASLYVGDLEPNVVEAQLFDIFNKVGSVVSIRLCRDLMTRRSLGYAFVNYRSTEDGRRALELLNFTLVNGKPVRIMFSTLDPSGRKSGVANIFIKNLDRLIDSKALFDTFSIFGSILSCKVATNSSGESKGYGFVQFEQEASAESAIEKVNGMLLNDMKVFVGPFVRRQERDHFNDASQFRNLYVKNFTKATTEEDLRARFGTFGPINSAVVMRDSKGRSKCFGFINFLHADDAAKAAEALNGKKFDEKKWYVGRAQRKPERKAELREKFGQDRPERNNKCEGRNLYLKNLNDTVDDKKLRELFAEFGSITSCKVVRNSGGRCRGSGFVAFSTREEANRAIANMNGRMVCSKPLYVALAQRKKERSARLEAHFAQKRTRSLAGVGPAAPSGLSTAGLGIGQQFFYSQPPPIFLFPQQMPTAFGIRPGTEPGPLPSSYVPVVQRQSQQGGQRANGMRGGGAPQHQQEQQELQEQILPWAGNHGFRHTSNARNAPDVAAPQPPQGIMGPLLPLHVPLQFGVVPVPSFLEVPQPLSINEFASALTSAPQIAAAEHDAQRTTVPVGRS